MELKFSAADRAFRDEVRAFLEAELPTDIRERWKNNPNVLYPEKDDLVRWHKILDRKGWAVPSWPVEWGGTGWTPTQRYIWEDESNRAGAPMLNALGLRMVAPVLMAFGSDEQKQRFLPPIKACDEVWCQGYSEPGAGSDLASVQCRAVPEGDDYVINGSKIWTTFGHYADWMFALVRTSTESKKQLGITFVLIDMKTPGITVRPLVAIGGQHELNQVFFDDVRVPKANRIGEEGKGWTVAKYLLEFERGASFYAGRVMANLERLRRVLALQTKDGRPLMEDAAFRRKVGEVTLEQEMLALTEARVLSAVSRGGRPGSESSIIKLVGSELNQRVTELIVEALAQRACPFDKAAIDQSLYGGNAEGAFMELQEAGAAARYFNFRAATIFSGTSEIQHDIIAKAILKL